MRVICSNLEPTPRLSIYIHLNLGIYPTNGPEACEYILKDSNCAILVVEDDNQLNKVKQCYRVCKKVEPFLNMNCAACVNGRKIPRIPLESL